MIATRTTEKISWIARAKPYLTGLAKEDETDRRLDAGMWPSNNFVDSVCGHEDETVRGEHAMSITLPDCILDENSFVAGTYKDMVLLKRNVKEKKLADVNDEVQQCTEQDMIQIYQFYKEYGSHVITGITMGGSIEEHRVMKSPGTAADGEEEEQEQEEEDGAKKKEKNGIRKKRKQVDSVDVMLRKDALKITNENKFMKKETEHDSPQRLQKDVPFTFSEKMKRWSDLSKFTKKIKTEQEMNRVDQTPINDISRRRRRRLLFSLRHQHQTNRNDDDNGDNEYEKKQEEEDEDLILSRSMYVNGVVDVPYNVKDISIEDVSKYWSSIEQGTPNPLHLKTESVPISDLLIQHAGIRYLCTKNNNPNITTTSSATTPSANDLPNTFKGRSLIRKSNLLHNFIVWMDTESSSTFHMLIHSESIYTHFQRSIGMLTKISNEFITISKQINEIDQKMKKVRVKSTVRRARSTAVDISIPPPSIKPVSVLLPRSLLSKNTHTILF